MLPRHCLNATVSFIVERATLSATTLGAKALTASKVGAIEAAVELSRVWPSAPAAAQGLDAGQLDDAKRLVETQLVIMEADSTTGSRPIEDLMPGHMAAGGDEMIGASVQAQLERWSNDPFARAAP